MSKMNWSGLAASQEVGRLREQLAAEAKRREEAERERDEARGYENAARQHTRFVETAWAERFDEVDAARERAEADNAALLAECVRHEASEECRESMSVVTDAAHPGAALLERLRALEALASAVREYLSPTFPSTVGDLLPVRNALADLDALKVPRE